MLKKILITLTLIVFLATSVLAPFARAQGEGNWYNQSFSEFHSKVYNSPGNEIFGERYTTAQVQWVIYGLFSTILHLPFQGDNDAMNCIVDNTADISACAGAVGDLVKKILPELGTSETSQSNKNNWFVSIGNRPVSFITYVKDIAKKIAPVKEVQAQGFGYTAINPVLKLWKASRNIAYTFLTLAIVALAFMIMFRVKINPQTVISVQSVLPKVVIALILITFSYAIAGLLIDLMYVVIGVVSMIFSSAGLSELESLEIFRRLTTWNAWGLIMLYWLNFIIASFTSIFTLGLGAVSSALLTVFAVVSIIFLLWYLLKITIMLLKTYVNILILIIVAPLQILIGVLTPGAGIGPWLRSMVSKLAVYPLLSILFLLAFLFLAAGLPDWAPSSLNAFAFDPKLLGGKAWDPPLTVGTGAGDLTHTTSRFLWIVTSYAIIAMTPKVIQIIQSIMEKKPFAYDTAIGEALSPATSIGRMAAGYGGPEAYRKLLLSKRYKDIMDKSRAGQAINSILQRIKEGLDRSQGRK